SAAGAEATDVVWEYAAGASGDSQEAHRWKRLGARDETRGFAERGMIGFVGPQDMVRHAEFGRELFWLRARPEGQAPRAQPRLRGLLTNTVWASQATTLEDEALGSSDGSPGQTVRTAQAPVLLGQQIVVREP